jgi:Outer membrane protein beta-barrel domain
MINCKSSRFKLIAIIFILTNIFVVQNAQGDDDKDRKYGIRAGFQSSEFVKDGGVDYDARSGFYIGGYRVNKIMPTLSLQTGLEYVQCGATGDPDYEFRLNYLSLPLSLRFKLGPVFILGGVNANFKVAESLEIAGQEVEIVSENESPLMDVPLHAGLGVNILFLAVEARYHYGLVELDEGYHNSYLQLGLALHF